MRYLKYECKSTKWGKIIKYDTSDIPQIVTYERIITEREVEFPEHSHPELEVYSIIKGRASIFTEKEFKLKKNYACILYGNEKHSVLLREGCIVDVMRFEPEEFGLIIAPLAEKAKTQKLEITPLINELMPF
jgi:hypothetical protein